MRSVTPSDDHVTHSAPSATEARVQHPIPGNCLNLSDALLLVDSARELLAKLDGVTYDDTQARSPISSHAQTSRHLLAASAQLRRAACEVDAQYWAGRGFPDPLEEQ